MSSERPSLSRRDALKWFAGSAAGTAALPAIAAKNETEPAPAYPIGRSPIFDPDFMKPAVFPWDKLLTPEELKTTATLADLILPNDANGPAATEVGATEFINEWVSAPYPAHTEDRELIRGGLAWLNTESFRRFEKRFDELNIAEQSQIADDICSTSKAKPEHKVGAAFFNRFRSLTLSAYYTHSTNWKQLGYVGNVTMAGAYPGVPDEIIKKLGLEDVV